MIWILAGAGAQGRITFEILRALEPEAEVFFLDDSPELAGGTLLGAEILSRAAFADRFPPSEIRMLITVGHNLRRMELAAELEHSGYRFATVMHPRAFVQSSAKVGPGTVIYPGAIVQSGARIGAQVVVNTGAIVEHDCEIGDGASISPGACMAGRCVIGEASFIGTGAVLCPRVTIGAGAIVGAGAVVASDVAAGTLAYGVPARAIRAVEARRDWRRVL